MNRFLVLGCAAGLLLNPFAHTTQQPQANPALRWGYATLEAARDSHLDAPIISRALAIVHTCMYDAWAAYDGKAVGTQLAGALRRPVPERTLANKEKAVSYAAYRALVDVLPADTESVYKPLMKELGYDPNDNSTDIETPAGIGHVACAAVLEFRHHDKSNQLGDLAPGPYSDWTHFRPVNMPAPFPTRLPSTHPVDMNHWQPLIYVNSTGSFTTQMFTEAHWCYVTPFALASSKEFRSIAKEVPPPAYGPAVYREQLEELIRLSAGLTDEQKMLAEYWTGIDSHSSPARWNEIAQWISARDHHTMDDDVKMFFALNNALLDASIAAWDLKREFNSVRPITAITLMFNGRKIRAWGGPSKGTVDMDGSNWVPYQPATLPSPPSPDYASEASAFAAAAASILRSWTGTDSLGYSVTFSGGSSTAEPRVTPARELSLKLETFTEVADAAGRSSRYAGTSFPQSDLAGRELGQKVAEKVLAKANRYFDGVASFQATPTDASPLFKK